MATATIDIGTLIMRSPDIRGGRPHIANTGVTVQRIVGWYKLGLSPEEIAQEFGHLTMAQVHAALAYYHANREEIESAIAEDEMAGDAAEAEWIRTRTSQSTAILGWESHARHSTSVRGEVRGRYAEPHRISD